jgi:hypothetical protein
MCAGWWAFNEKSNDRYKEKAKGEAMKIFRLSVAGAIFVAAICMVILAVKSCGKLDLKEKIRQDEKEIKLLDSIRATANAVPIPFKSDTVRNKVLESVNHKTGLDLHLRKPKGY